MGILGKIRSFFSPKQQDNRPFTYRELADEFNIHAKEHQNLAGEMIQALATPQGLHTCMSEAGVQRTAFLVKKHNDNLHAICKLFSKAHYDVVKCYNEINKATSIIEEQKKLLKIVVGTKAADCRDKITEQEIHIRQMNEKYKKAMNEKTGLASMFWKDLGLEFEVEQPRKASPGNELKIVK